MDGYLQGTEKKGGLNKTLLGAFIIGAIVISAFIGIILMRPTTKQIQEQVIENALREGNPEFELYTKKISIQTDTDRTTSRAGGSGQDRRSMEKDATLCGYPCSGPLAVVPCARR